MTTYRSGSDFSGLQNAGNLLSPQELLLILVEQ
jgi:hypothetical protein